MNNIDKYYVGEIKFEHNINDNKESVFYREAIFNGACELPKERVWQLGKEYSVLFTLLYKIDNERYVCLHNNEIYSNVGKCHVGAIIPFTDFLPKLDFSLSSNMSDNDFISLFDKIVNNKQVPLYNNKRPADSFYDGTIEICVERETMNNKYPYQKDICNVNVCETVPLRSLYIKDGKKVVSSFGEFHFKIYKSLFYLFKNGSIYNLNNHVIYDSKKINTPNPNYNITLNECIADIFRERNTKQNIIDITISKALKLQKKIY